MSSTLLFVLRACHRRRQPLRTAVAETCADLRRGITFVGAPVATMLLFVLDTDDVISSEPWVMLLPVIAQTVRCYGVVV